MSYLDQIDAASSPERWPLVRSWMQQEPLPFFAQMRRYRPVLHLDEVTLAFGHADCTQILARHDLFSVAPYRDKQGAYWMAQDDTARHWHEKSVMKAVLDVELVPEIRSWAEDETARRIASASGQTFEMISEVTRGIPLAMVQRFFGFDGASAADLLKWSYWNQMDAFWNQPFDDPQFATPDQIIENREAANAEMRSYIIGLVQTRGAEVLSGQDNGDMVSRLLKLSSTGALRLDVPLIALNVGGLLIGAIETTSHAVANALMVLSADPARRAAATSAAMSDDRTAIDGHVYEALRFRPAFPYFFRRAEAETQLARGTDHETTVPQGGMVLAVTHSAMFDSAAYDTPDNFDSTRNARDTFTFGYGIHECLGRAIGAALVPAIVRSVLHVEGAAPGTVNYSDGPVPETWPWSMPAQANG